jgi:uncharacterized protein YjbI with pentapeptide repeats
MSIRAPLLLLMTWLAISPTLADDFVGKDLQKQDRAGQDLEGSDFTDANCFLTNFRGAKLSKCSFRDANLLSATFSEAEMKECDFRGATLANSSFQEADLAKANLEGVDLTSVSFQNAKLRGAKLRKAKGFTDFTRADLREADLRGANMLGMKDYGGTTAKFTGAKYDKSTRWPKGFDVEASGAVLVEADDDSAEEKPARKKKSKPAEDDAEEEATESASGAPAEKLIKKTLEKEMWGPPGQGGVTHTYEYKLFKIAAPREGNFRTDGTPANRKTMVYPVKVEVVITREFSDGVTREETKKQSYNFFQDDFGDWTYRFVQNN